jgi:hypothetical protein
MSASLVTHVLVRCCNLCLGPFKHVAKSTDEAQEVALARSAAKGRGWHHIGGDDYCPRCSKGRFGRRHKAHSSERTGAAT